MGSYILCQVPQAKTPYYIENISTNIYSIEELCFYLHHNIYLLDDTILNEELCRWLRDELGLKKLYQKLYPLLEKRKTVGEFILPIFKEINFLTHSEFKEINEQLQRLEEQPLLVRQKQKGDYLTKNGKYVNAIRVYQQTLVQARESQLGEQFLGEIYNNMGCAYVHLFQMEEALECFENALQLLTSEIVKRNCMMAAYMVKGTKEAEEEFPEETLSELERAGREIYENDDGAEFKDAFISWREGRDQDKTLEKLLQKWIGDYHKQTGY